MRPGRTLWVAAVLSVTLAGCAVPHHRAEFSAQPSPKINQAKVADKSGRTPGLRQEIVQTALTLLGVPYRYGGTTPRGFDCSGYVRYVYRKAAGLLLPRVSGDQVRVGRAVHASDLKPADLIFFKFKYQKSLHVGIYIGEGRFVHAPSSGGRVNVQKVQSAYWKKRYVGARRIL